MATVQQTRESWAASDKRVRSPLQALRSTIRRYVALEGAFIAIIYMALVFWIGLLIDYGCFRLFLFDWILELNFFSAGGPTASVLRGVLLAVIVIGLVVLVVMKVVIRLTREFSDRAVALVLERRFPRELGDRLITAIEMSDPTVADKLGYSATLVERTIQEAVERVERLPVHDAFDWARLHRLGWLATLATIGVYLIVGATTCLAGFAFDTSTSPSDYFWEFNDVAGTWAERTLLLENTYWPRRAFLEVLNFQDTPSHPGEMRMGRDDQHLKLEVRALEWVVADRSVLEGWRALRWHDLDDYLPDLVTKVAIPVNWTGWARDGSSLDEGDDWHAWTIDKLKQQQEKDEVRRALRAEFPDAATALDNVFIELTTLTASASQRRHLRHLAIPKLVEVYYRGAETKSSAPYPWQPGNRYALGLGELTESIRFTVKGEDYYTPTKYITLVAPPGIKTFDVDKEEPAYLYYRLAGDQTPLKGKRQHFAAQPMSITGDISSLDIPYGSNVTLRVEAERKIEGGVRMVAPGRREVGDSVLPIMPVTMSEDGLHFAVRFDNLVKTQEFLFEYYDEDKVRGTRHVILRPDFDRAPELVQVGLTPILRKPRFKSEPGATNLGALAESFLITPDAILPMKGMVKDDHNLAKVEWVYSAEERRFELAGSLSNEKTQGLIGDTMTRRMGLVTSSFQFAPDSLGLSRVAPAYWVWMTRLLESDLAQPQVQIVEEFSPVPAFQLRMEARGGDDVALLSLDRLLAVKLADKKLLREFNLEDDEGFDVRKYLKKLKTNGATNNVQLHYRVVLSVSASDNNVETGPGTRRQEPPIVFLVISENELLAQVSLEEEVLRDRLEKAYQKLKIGKVVMDDQITKLSADGLDYALTALRADEVRKGVMDSSGISREVYADFSRIQRELEVNRVQKRHIDEVRDKIVLPLAEIINPTNGNFAITEDMVQKLYQSLDDESNRKGDQNRLNLQRNAVEVRRQLEVLMDRLNAVLLAMEEGITYGKLLETIVNVEREQRQAAEFIRAQHDLRVQELIDELTRPKQ